MAQLVTGAMGSLISKLGDLLSHEYKLQTGVKKQVESLRGELEPMHAVLRKVGDLRPEQLDDMVKLWARQARELSYDMEDALDDFLVRVDDETRHRKGLMNWLRDLFGNFKARHQIAGTIQEIDRRVKELEARHGRYTVHSIVANPVVDSIDPRVLNLHKQQLVGVDRPRDKIIEMLRERDDDASGKTAKVVSIWGCGGLGKTALARAVYNKLTEGFDCRAFVPVGQNPSAKKLLGDLLIDLDKQKYTNSNFNWTILDERQLVDELREFLDNKRYFIVIDDLWDKEPWGVIKGPLVDNSCGSKIVITSRILDVANYVGNAYKLQPLSREYSEKLLHSRLVAREGECPKNQSTEVYDKIFQKCGGIPLAIIAMASLLANKPRECWSEVYKSIGFAQSEGDGTQNTRLILSYSYYDLPSHLKTCLLYLSKFPEDHFIKKYPLIWEWIAEGFIDEEQGALEVGERYFNEFINRSMIEPTIEFDTNVNGCRVHDIVLGVLRSLSDEQNFITRMDNEQGTFSQSKEHPVRRLAIENSKNLEHNIHADMSLQHVRSFAAFSCNGSLRVHRSFRKLRVLNMQNCLLREGLVHIGDLLHLRYLGLRDTQINELPKEICRIKLLQTLDLEGTVIKKWPTFTSSVGQLTQLLCLRIDRPTPLSGQIGKMTALQELDIDCRDNSTKFIKELGNLRDLRVLSATIIDAEVGDVCPGRLLLQSLGNLQKIRCVKIYSFTYSMNVTNWKFTGELTSSSFLGQLRYLRIDMLFSRMPRLISSSFLPNLSVLSVFVDDVQEHDMKTLGKMPELRSLALWRMRSDISKPSVIIIGEDCYFKKLVQFSTNFNLEFRIPQRTHDDNECGSSVAPAILPSLEEIRFNVHVRFMKKARIGLDQLRPDILPSLKICSTTLFFRVDTEEKEASEALRHTAAVHPNRPILNLQTLRYDALTRVVEVVLVRKEKDERGSFDFSRLLTYHQVEKFGVCINCENATLEEVEEAEAVLRHAVDLHPNHPELEITRYSEDKIISAPGQQQQGEGCQ